MQLGDAILVLTGIRPVPTTLAVNRKSLRIKFPYLMEVLMDRRIDIRHERVITGIEHISPESVPAY